MLSIINALTILDDYFKFKISGNECSYVSIKLYIDILLDTCKSMIKFSYVN